MMAFVETNILFYFENNGCTPLHAHGSIPHSLKHAYGNELVKRFWRNGFLVIEQFRITKGTKRVPNRAQLLSAQTLIADAVFCALRYLDSNAAVSLFPKTKSSYALPCVKYILYLLVLASFKKRGKAETKDSIFSDFQKSTNGIQTLHLNLLVPKT